MDKPVSPRLVGV